MSRQALTQVLRRIPTTVDRRLLVGTATGDDAGVYKIDRDRALVQTTDFRDRLACSRRVLVPLLDYFDRVGLTLREGDRRRLLG